VTDSASIWLQDGANVVDITPVVSRFVYKSSLIKGYVQWRMKFRVFNWDFWKNFMIGNSLRFAVKIRDEWNGRSRETNWLPLVVDLSGSDLQSTRIDANVTGGGTELLMMNEEKRRSFPRMTASQVIQRVATDYVLKPNIRASTATKTWYQSNQTDWDLLQEVLTDYVAFDGRGDSFLNIEGTNLIVQAINYAAPVKRFYDLTAPNRHKRVPKVSVRYYGGQVARKGGLIVEARGFDRSTGLPVTFTANPIVDNVAALKEKLPKKITAAKRVVITGRSDLRFVRARALREQAKYSIRYYGVAIKVLGELQIKLRDMISISVKDSDGKGSPNEGKYGVFEYTIDYALGRTQTTVVGYRREASVGPATSVGTPAMQPVGTDTDLSSGTPQRVTVKTSVPLGS
jgi:hypothetical protein